MTSNETNPTDKDLGKVAGQLAVHIDKLGTHRVVALFNDDHEWQQHELVHVEQVDKKRDVPGNIYVAGLDDILCDLDGMRDRYYDDI